jgi:hypothetical protein
MEYDVAEFAFAAIRTILQVIPGFELTDSESRFATVLGISLLILQ